MNHQIDFLHLCYVWRCFIGMTMPKTSTILSSSFKGYMIVTVVNWPTSDQRICVDAVEIVWLCDGWGLCSHSPGSMVWNCCWATGQTAFLLSWPWICFYVWKIYITYEMTLRLVSPVMNAHVYMPIVSPNSSCDQMLWVKSMSVRRTLDSLNLNESNKHRRQQFIQTSKPISISHQRQTSPDAPAWFPA